MSKPVYLSEKTNFNCELLKSFVEKIISPNRDKSLVRQQKCLSTLENFNPIEKYLHSAILAHLPT